MIKRVVSNHFKGRKKMRKKMWWIIAILLVLVGAFVYYYAFFDYIETIDYSLIKKYGNYYNVDKENILNEVVSEDGESIYDYYNDYVVVYIRQPSGRYIFSRIQFCTDAYTFGIGNITVGTSKSKVERFMRNTKKAGISTSSMCDENGQLLDITTYEYTDKEMLHLFSVAYDEEDNVSYITIGPF